jgi:hypothetical protein
MRQNARWVIIASAFATIGCEPSTLPATPLFKGVGDYRQGTRLIQDRLNAQFPKGSSTAKLEDYLRQQGLDVGKHPTTPTSGVASFKYTGSVCGSQVRVSWKGDSAGRVESIDALFSDTGCP